jgi:uracil-DNA glycosylase
MEFKLETSWERELKDEFNKPYFEKLIEFIEHEYQIHPDSIFPKKNEIFAAFNACPFDKVKVVILGQDPYPTKSHAHGLSFSVQDDITPLPKSLQNIFKEIQSDLGIPSPENGNLTRWANQGVLLLNATLTVQEGKPESHANRGWEIFTDVVISKLNQQQNHLVYLLWGTKAQNKAQQVDDSRNLILHSPHPSPLSVYRGFFGCKHFSKTNHYLKQHGKKEIVW